ncbi:hypothetical protein WJX79_004562 [Trebouxia sp. C0005]
MMALSRRQMTLLGGNDINPVGVSGASVRLRQFSSTPPDENSNSKKQKTTPQQRKHTLSEAGWTHQTVYNIPNALSMARLVSGPIIAWLILNEQWGVALVSLAISGASDWADGYVAKRFGQSSVLGSYLDPLADKVLIGSVVAALGYQGSLPLWLVSVIIGRDVVLLSGAFIHRFRTEALAALGVATGGTTLASCGAYARAYLSGTIK